jgi:hypothetical protein
MASARQVAANRKNARKSTGPRTRAGKQRACRNANRHGLSIPIDNGESCDAVRSLVRRIAPGSTDQDLLGWATVAARAELELVRIRHLKSDIVDRMAQFDAMESAAFFRARAAQIRDLESLLDTPWCELKPPPPWTARLEVESEAEAVRRVLAELRKLNRYEARACAIKLNALREVSRRMSGTGMKS